MPDNTTETTSVEDFVQALVLPILTGEWITWEEGDATEFRNQFKAVLELVNMARQRCDEQLDSAHNVGKFAKMERIRKARTSDDGPKVDPLAAALSALTSK